MPSPKPTTVSCSNCGATVPVRNMRKAKTVVCASCSSQLDLRAADLAVIAEVEKAPNTTYGILPGMRGTLPDGRACEVVGRIRYEEWDESAWWPWDEWQLVTENGEYVWLEADEGKFSLMQRFDPEEPPSLDDLKKDWFTVDGESWRVEESGNARIAAIEGELTWRASPGDKVWYVDARSEGHHLAVEWTAEEIEFFHSIRLMKSEVLAMVGLEDLAVVEMDAEERHRAALARNAHLTHAGLICGGGAAAAVGYTVVEDPPSHSKYHSKLSTADLQQGLSLLSADLEMNRAYDARIYYGKASKGLGNATLDVVLPSGLTQNLVTYEDNLGERQGRMPSRYFDFTPDEPGLHEFRFTAPNAVDTPEGKAPLVSISTSVREESHVVDGLYYTLPAFLLVGLALLAFGAQRRKRLAFQLQGELEDARQKFLAEKRREARIQE